VALIKNEILQYDPSIVALQTMAFTLKLNDDPKVDIGICCAFGHSILPFTKSTIVTPPRAPEFSSADSDDAEFTLITNNAANKNCRRHLNNN
jgi:hypothetical protein